MPKTFSIGPFINLKLLAVTTLSGGENSVAAKAGWYNFVFWQVCLIKQSPGN